MPALRLDSALGGSNIKGIHGSVGKLEFERQINQKSVNVKFLESLTLLWFLEENILFGNIQ